jgi:opacity protein-like surface antigen
MSVFGFGASFLFHLATGRISPYIGAGAMVDFGSTKTTPGHLDTDTVDIPSMSQFGLAAHMLIGGEFFLVKNLSFSAEYRLGYGMSQTTQKMDFADPTWDDWETKGSMHGMGLVSSTFLILTLYII